MPVAEAGNGNGHVTSRDSEDRDRCSDFELKGLQKAAAVMVQQHAFAKKGEEQSEGFTRSISLYWHWVRGQKAASKMGKVGTPAALHKGHMQGIRLTTTHTGCQTLPVVKLDVKGGDLPCLGLLMVPKRVLLTAVTTVGCPPGCFPACPAACAVSPRVEVNLVVAGSLKESKQVVSTYPASD